MHPCLTFLLWTYADRSLNKSPRKRPTFNALLEHPWLLPLSPSLKEWKSIEETNKRMIGEWVRDTIEQSKQAKDERGSDVVEEEERRAKPPLHSVATKPTAPATP